MSLSKSQYLRGMQCKKSLWLKQHKKEALVVSKEAQAVFTSGTNIGELACKLFPKGERIEYSGDFIKQAQQTKELLDKGVETIYEATFIYDEIVVMVDILQNTQEGFIFNEVKSTANALKKDEEHLEDVYSNDLAIQYFVISNLGYKIKQTNLIYINKNYVREDELEINKLFTSFDATQEVMDKQREVLNNIKELKEVVSMNNEPNIDISTYCEYPYPCDAREYCWAKQRGIDAGARDSVFRLHRLPLKEKINLYKQGILSFKELPKDYKLNQRQKFQIEDEYASVSEPFKDKRAIKEFLDSLQYPLYHLDFETYIQSIPKYKGMRPFMQIPFQYSLHIQHKNGELEHKEFLAQNGVDDRYNLAKRLTQDIPKEACVLAYNMQFEKSVIKNLAETYEDLKEHLMAIYDNMKDLMLPFAKNHYYHKNMLGSHSLKVVLPSIDEEMANAYKDLPLIHNGGEAMEAFAKMEEENLNKEEMQKYREGLLAYCKLDTLAMVRIIERLKEGVGDSK